MEKKETNPKDSIGIKKVPFSTLSGPVLAELGLAMLEGALKYGRHNYRVAGVRHSVYHDASMRHQWSDWEGEDIDPDSGLSHLIKSAACNLVLRDAQIHGKYFDDRPPRTPSGWIANYNKIAKAMIEKIKNPAKAFTNLNSKNSKDDEKLKIIEEYVNTGTYYGHTFSEIRDALNYCQKNSYNPEGD